MLGVPKSRLAVVPRGGSGFSCRVRQGPHLRTAHQGSEFQGILGSLVAGCTLGSPLAGSTLRFVVGGCSPGSALCRVGPEADKKVTWLREPVECSNCRDGNWESGEGFPFPSPCTQNTKNVETKGK